MRFIHTADWHIGKLFGQRYMTADQEHVLRQLVAAVRENDVEAVVIAGDIYDRSVPPAEAVELFSEVLGGILAAGAKVLFISGNHDSARRLSFGEDVFSRAGVYIRARLTADLSPVVLESRTGPCAFSLIPYFDPYDVRDVFGVEGRLSFDEAAEIVVSRAAAALPAGMPSVAVAHAFIAGGTMTESVRALSVGGSDQIAASHFAPFSYTALGHLHGPSRAGGENIRYSGSPLCYSFDEAKQKKGFEIVDIDAKGALHREFHPLEPLHHVRIVEGLFSDLLAGSDPLPRDDYVFIRLLDHERPLNVREKLSERYDSIFGFAFPEIETAREESEVRAAREDLADDEKFAAFFHEMTGEAMTDEETSYLRDLLEEMAREKRAEKDGRESRAAN